MDHGHNTNNAFSNVWIFSEEEFDFEKTKKLFSKQKKENHDRIPDVFLAVDKKGNRHAYRINWETETYKEIELKF